MFVYLKVIAHTQRYYYASGMAAFEFIDYFWC